MSRRSRREIRRALADPELRVSLDRFARTNRQQRRRGMRSLPSELTPERLLSLRRGSLRNLGWLLDTFQEAALRSGMEVLRVSSPEAAAGAVSRVLHQAGVTRAVKTKSLLSEEIGLNRRLARKGIQVVESDLGEWILQQAGDRPSHLVAPAVHWSREQVARLVARVLRNPELEEADPAELVRAVRKRLRDDFLEAQAGITGANLLVASTGGVVLLTNEGNGHLTSGLPPLQVILASSFKLVADWSEAAALLRVIPRSATGQISTVYTNLIHGPAPAGGLGPRRVVLVLWERPRPAEDEPEMLEALCIRCGACLAACPTYREVGGGLFGGRSSMGGIGAVAELAAGRDREARRLAEYCLGCDACRDICPLGLDIPRAIVGLRARTGGGRGVSGLVVRHVLPRAGLTGLALSAARGGPEAPGALARRWGGPLPRPADEFLPPRDGPGGEGERRIILYPGCAVRYFLPRLGQQAGALLQAAGWTPEIRAPACCGFPAYQAGEMESAREMARGLVRLLRGTQPVVLLCPTCHRAMAELVPELLRGSPEEEAAAALPDRLRDWTELMVETIPEHETPGAAAVTVHDPCHAVRGLGLRRAPRDLVRRLGRELREMPGADECCGFGGLFSLDQPELSRALLARKVEAVSRSGAGVVVTSCPGCILRIRSGLPREIRVCHPAELAYSISRGITSALR